MPDKYSSSILYKGKVRLARKLKAKKNAISRIENHAEDIKLSTLEKVAHALGKHLEVKIA